MKFKTLLFTLLLITITSTVFASVNRDSIGVENNNGKKVILHKLDPKDNYYSLGRRYKVSPKDIIAFNNNAPLIIGNVVKIPTDRPFLESSYNTPAKAVPPPAAQTKAVVQQPVAQTAPTVQPSQAPQQQVPSNQQQSTIDYKVSASETLYSIAKRFNTTVADIQQANGMNNSTTLSPGQIIKVPQNTPAPAVQQQVVAKPDNTAIVNPVAAVDSANASKFNSNKYGLYEKDEKGVATWMDSSDLDPNKKLVLHRTAPVGTVIKITNPMTNLTTYAKVVGKFTDNEDNKDVIIVVTKNVAQSIGAQDKRFRVTISYGSPNE